MKTVCLSLLFVVSLALSNPRHNNSKGHILQIDSTVLRLKNKKSVIDQYIDAHSKSVIVLVKVPGKKNLVLVKNEHWPGEIEYTYNVYKNPAGKIIFIAETPFSESGDWDIAYKHYFDERGYTYAFSKEESIFDDNVKGGVVREILSNYYDEAFKKVNQINRITDKDYKAIKKNKNGYDFREYKYSIYKNVTDCLNGYRIKLTN